jgi:hypothetical protein
MNSTCVVIERDLVDAADPIDWESPAGPADRAGHPGPGLPNYVFTGPGDRHWIGQRCEVLGAPYGDPSTQLVRLTCGCHAQVPSASLQPA